MLFITPPKIHDFKSPSPSPSPLLDIMHSLNNILSDEDEKKKVLDGELIKLLDGTPVQPTQPESKKFVPMKSSRNISNMFSDDKPQKPQVSHKHFSYSKTELSNVAGTQPFYPSNYRKIPKVVPEYSNQDGGSKKLFQNVQQPSSIYNKSLGAVPNQTPQNINSAGPSFQDLKVPVAAHW